MKDSCAVRFVGGPLDGHVQNLNVADGELVEHATFPINRNLFRLIARKPAGRPHPVTSVACYELVREGGQVKYQFQGALCTAMQER